jgi:hypothetical protein
MRTAYRPSLYAVIFFIHNMRIIKFLPFLLILTACTTTPSLKSFFVSDGVIQHFLSPTTWKARNSEALLDITYRTGSDLPAIVNISFYGKKNVPRNVRSISLHGAEVTIPLEEVTILFVNARKNELRITSIADRDLLIPLLNSEPITLRAEIDGAMHTHIPHKKFIELKDNFLIAVFY